METLGICWSLLVAAFRSQLEYRVNFLLMVIWGFLYHVTGYFFIWAVLSRFDALQGWSLGEVTFLYGLRLTAHALWLIPFNRLIEIEFLIRMGEFDRYLVRPLNPLLQLITSRVRINVLGDLSGGLVLFVAATRLVDIDWSMGAIAFLLLALIGGALVEASVQLATAALTFRLLETRQVRIFVDDIFGRFGSYPLSLFGGTVEFLLTFVVPVAFVAYLPASVLLDQTGGLMVTTTVAYAAPLVGIALFLAAYAFWRHEMRHYQSAGH